MIQMSEFKDDENLNYLDKKYKNWQKYSTKILTLATIVGISIAMFGIIFGLDRSIMMFIVILILLPVEIIFRSKHKRVWGDYYKKVDSLDEQSKRRLIEKEKEELDKIGEKIRKFTIVLISLVFIPVALLLYYAAFFRYENDAALRFNLIATVFVLIIIFGWIRYFRNKGKPFNWFIPTDNPEELAKRLRASRGLGNVPTKEKASLSLLFLLMITSPVFSFIFLSPIVARVSVELAIATPFLVLGLFALAFYKYKKRFDEKTYGTY